MRNIVLFAFVLATAVVTQAQSAELRTKAGCGPMQVNFQVKTSQGQQPAAQPESGKALVYVIEEEKPEVARIGHITTRVGLDGTWVGANHGDSYLSFAVTPGLHAICSDWQSSLESRQKYVAAVNLNAETGKTYYYHTVVFTGKEYTSLRLKPVDEAEAMILLSRSAASGSKPKK